MVCYSSGDGGGAATALKPGQGVPGVRLGLRLSAETLNLIVDHVVEVCQCPKAS
jgi:hypothetical protein